MSLSIRDDYRTVLLYDAPRSWLDRIPFATCGISNRAVHGDYYRVHIPTKPSPFVGPESIPDTYARIDVAQFAVANGLVGGGKPLPPALLVRDLDELRYLPDVRIMVSLFATIEQTSHGPNGREVDDLRERMHDAEFRAVVLRSDLAAARAELRALKSPVKVKATKHRRKIDI